MIFHARRFAAGVEPPVVHLLPALLSCLRAGLLEVLVEFTTACPPFLKLALQFRICGFGNVQIQFMVKVNEAQSVSITPESGAMPCLGRLIGPCAMRSKPGSVRNRQL